MTSLDFLCRHPTCTRLSVSAFSLGTIALTAGCSFADFSKTSTAEPACTDVNPIGDAGGVPVAHWTFNDTIDASTSSAWLDLQHQLELTPKGDPTDASAPSLSTVRLNGEGQSVYLDGHQYAQHVKAANDDPLFPEEFTISAWLALPPFGLDASASPLPVIWPIVSTFGNGGQCGGYQLDIRVEDPATGPELVLSYQFNQADDAGTECKSHELVEPIDNASWAWGVGRWHHVAGTYTKIGKDQATLALYWDGVRATVGSDPVIAGGFTYSDLILYLGTNGQGATSSAAKFKGYLDDFALFDHPLNDKELADFVALSSTRPGPSGCRWSTYEQWDNVANDPSSSRWASDSTATALKLDIVDKDWGAGFLSARLSPEKDLKLYSRVHLEAAIPSDEIDTNFQFSLANGDDFCTWILPANGAGTYDIDLTKPSSCTSSSCQFPMGAVQWAKISSDWKDAAKQEHLAFTVSRLDFDTEGDKVSPTNFGGAIGPKGWCWRPLAYELGAVAYWVGTPSSTSVAATLRGNAQSSSRIAADFGKKVLDLSGCNRVEISGQLAPIAGSSPYSFGLQDINGSWWDWDITSNGASYGATIINGGTSSNTPQTPQDATAYRKFFKFDIHNVNLVSIQKPWLYAGDTNIEISDIRFYDANDQPDCERLSAP
jgi:hypothetical protein